MNEGGPKTLELNVLVLNKYYMAVHVISARRAFLLLCKGMAEVVLVEHGQWCSYDLEAWLDLSEMLWEEQQQQRDCRTLPDIGPAFPTEVTSSPSPTLLSHSHPCANTSHSHHSLPTSTTDSDSLLDDPTFAASTEDGIDWIRSFRMKIQVPRIIRLLSYDRLPGQTVKFNRRNLLARDENRCQYCGKRLPASELTMDHVVPRSQGGSTTWENVVSACTTCNSRKGGRTPEQAQMRLRTKPRKPATSPLLQTKLTNAKYQSWRPFLDNASWAVEMC